MLLAAFNDWCLQWLKIHWEQLKSVNRVAKYLLDSTKVDSTWYIIKCIKGALDSILKYKKVYI